MTGEKRGPGRPATGQSPVRQIRCKGTIWDPFVRAAGDDHPEITRRLWAWFAGLPGAELPPRPFDDSQADADDVDEVGVDDT